MDWKSIAALLTVITILNAGFVWLVKSLLAADRKKLADDIKRITDNACKQDDRHDQLQKDFNELKARLPEKYVRREDWIISFSRIDQKIDGIWKFINRLLESGKII